MFKNWLNFYLNVVCSYIVCSLNVQLGPIITVTSTIISIFNAKFLPDFLPLGSSLASLIFRLVSFRLNL